MIAWAAFALRVVLRLLAGPGAAFSYDEGAYLSASALLARGHLLYRDVAAAHPPGFFVLMAPVTWIGRPSQVIVVARLVAAAAGGLAAWVVGDTVRRHRSAIGGMAAALTYAVVPQALAIDRTVFIEPVLNLLLLVAARAWLLAPEGSAARSTRGRTTGARSAGVAWGLAVLCKATAVALVVPVAITGAMRRRGRSLIVVGTSAVLVVVAGLVPVALTAGRPFVRQVLLFQFRRTDAAADPGDRLHWVLGVGGGDPRAMRALLGTAVLAVGVVVLLIGVRRRRSDEVLVFGLSWGASVIAMLLSTRVFLVHYNALLSPPVALVAGAVVAQLAVWPSVARRRVLRFLAPTVVGLGLAVPLLLRLVAAGPGEDSREAQSEVAALVRRHRGCLWTWNPEWLVVGDRWPDVDRFGPSASDPLAGGSELVSPPGDASTRLHGVVSTSSALVECPYVLTDGEPAVLVDTHRVLERTGPMGPSLWVRRSRSDG